MSKVVVLAEHKVLPQFAEQFSALVRSHAKRCVHIEPGCLHFSVSQDSTDANKWYYCELYASQKDFDVHCSSPHYLMQIETVKPMLDGEVRFSVSQLVEWSSKASG